MALTSAQRINDIASQVASFTSDEMWQFAELLNEQYKTTALLLAADLSFVDQDIEVED